MSKLPHAGRKKGPQEVRTPTELFALLGSLWPIRIDLAASASNALCSEYITEEENSLLVDWSQVTGPDAFGFCNPGFSAVPKEFAPKFREEVERGARFITLTLASLGSRWYANFFHGAPCEVRVLTGRLRWPGYAANDPREHMITIWDGRPFRGPWPWDWRAEQRRH